MQNSQNIFDNIMNDSHNFSGVFTNETRKILRAKRLQLGLSFEALGKFFGVNWSTVRKWEQGPTRSCAGYFVTKITRFLDGRYDNSLGVNNPSNPRNSLYRNPLPEPVSQCSERVTNTYLLCRHNPDLRKELLNNVVNVTNAVLNNLTSISRDDTDNPSDADLF